VPANFADRIGEVWWLALEQVVARNDRIGLFIGGNEFRPECRSIAAKHETFAFLFATLGAMTPPERSVAIRDLCARYGVDLHATSAQAVMSWPDIAKLAADPMLTIGSASLTYPVLSRLGLQQSERELRMGRTVAEGAVGRPVTHLAYPHGTRDTFGRREMALATELGFASAVTAEPGVIRPDDVEMMALPRIAWDGTSLRACRALLTGLTLKRRLGESIAGPSEDPSST
jgi:hypothetical protein